MKEINEFTEFNLYKATAKKWDTKTESFVVGTSMKDALSGYEEGVEVMEYVEVCYLSREVIENIKAQFRIP